MIVLGIDPGLSCCGYGAIAVTPPDLEVVSAGTIITPTDVPVAARLAELRAELRLLYAELRPDVVVVERVFFQTNASTAMSVGQANGVALLTAEEAGCGIAEYTSNEVKLAVAGDGAATKEQVQQMVARLLHLPRPPRPPDVADALALAVCHVSAMPFKQAADRAASGQIARGRPMSVAVATRHRYTPNDPAEARHDRHDQ